jgi:hypothetical protein
MSERLAGSRIRRPYDARPGRAAVVVDDLSELRGPTSGTIELSNRLFWQPDRHFDLDDADSLVWMYENVLREAASFSELRTWIDGPTLIRLWPTLFVPRGVRAAWERQHPQLRRQSAAA